MIEHWQVICLILGIASGLLFAGRIRHMLRRSVYARDLGGKYDSISGRIFIRRNGRLIEFTAVEKGNAYVPRPTMMCSMKKKVRCEVVPGVANPVRTARAENMPSKEIRIGSGDYTLRAETSDQLKRVEDLIHNAAFSLLFSSVPGSMPSLQIYPLSDVAVTAQETEDSQVLLTELPERLVNDSALARRYIDAFNEVVADISGVYATRR